MFNMMKDYKYDQKLWVSRQDIGYQRNTMNTLFARPLQKFRLYFYMNFFFRHGICYIIFARSQNISIYFCLSLCEWCRRSKTTDNSHMARGDDGMCKKKVRVQIKNRNMWSQEKVFLMKDPRL